MIRGLFATFLNSYTETQKLTARYRALTNRLGLVTVALSCVGMIGLMYLTWTFFGLPLKGGSIEGLRIKLIGWVALTIVLVPLAFYLGMVVVYGVAALAMFVLGKLSWQEALDLCLSAKYPRSWYPEP